MHGVTMKNNFVCMGYCIQSSLQKSQSTDEVTRDQICVYV